MALINFLKQTCTIQERVLVNDNGTQRASYTPIYTDIPCFLYTDRRGLEIDSISTETQTGDIKLIIERDKNLVQKDQRVTVTDPELWSLWVYIVSLVEIHRSFTWIGGVSLTLKKLEDGVN